MSRCVEWYDKFERDGNFCGLSATGISQVKAYNEMRKKIAVHVPDKAFVVENFTEGAARVLSSVKDDETRTSGMNYVIECLKRKEKVTAGDLKKTIQGWLKPDSCPVDNPGHVSKNFANAKSPSEQKSDPETSPQPSLAEQQAGKEEPAPATMEALETPMEPVAEPSKKTVDWSIETCRSGTCPDGQNHRIKGSKEANLGDKCALSGGFVRDQKACHYLEGQKRAAAEKPEGFVHAGTGAPSIASGLPKAQVSTNARRLVIDFNERQWQVLYLLQDDGRAETFIEAVLFLVDEVGRERGLIP
jgi:hypothetical protein